MKSHGADRKADQDQEVEVDEGIKHLINFKR